MFDALLRKSWLLCIAGVLAACGGGSDSDTSGTPPADTPTTQPTATQPATTSTTLDASGGTVAGPDGVTVTVPTGALAAATTITVAQTSTGTPASLPKGSANALAQSKVYELTPHDVSFSQPVTIRIPIDTSKGTPRVYVSDKTSGWYPQEVSATGNGYVEVERTGFSWIYSLVPGASLNDTVNAISIEQLDVTPGPGLGIDDPTASYWHTYTDMKFGVRTALLSAFKGRPASGRFTVSNDWATGKPYCQASQLSLEVLAFGQWVFLGQYAATSKTVVTAGDYAMYKSNFDVNFTVDYPGVADFRVRTVCDNVADLKAIDPRLAEATWRVRLTVYQPYSVGGTVSGLPDGGSVKLALNGGTAQTVSANGAFKMDTPLRDGASYTVTASDMPTHYSCSLSNASGTIAAANMSGVSLSCSPTPVPYKFNGYVTGLPTGSSVTLLANGTNGQTVTNTDGTADDLLPFTLASPVWPGSAYNISVGAVSAAGYACTLAGGSGTMPYADVSDLFVTCHSTTPVTLGGTVTGLDVGPFPNVVLMLNSDSAQTTRTPLTGNGAYTLGAVAGGTPYFVSVDTTGTGYSCFVVNASGASSVNVSNLDVSCRGSTPPAPPMGPSAVKSRAALR